MLLRRYKVHEYLIVMKTHEVEAASVEEAVKWVVEDEPKNLVGIEFSEHTGDFLVDEMQDGKRVGSFFCNLPEYGKITIERRE